MDQEIFPSENPLNIEGSRSWHQLFKKHKLNICCYEVLLQASHGNDQQQKQGEDFVKAIRETGKSHKD
jgi:hypothetical protein